MILRNEEEQVKGRGRENSHLSPLAPSPPATSFIHLPFTILLPGLHPSFSLSCHNASQSGV